MTNWATETTRVRRDCTHTRRHTHGTLACYTQDRCRCGECTTAAREYARTRRRATAYGRPFEVDAAPALAHIQTLRAHGMTIAHIATAAGITHSGLTDLIDRDSGKVHATTRDAILAVQPANPTDHTGLRTGMVRAVGTARRVRALGAIGWSQQQIADHAGLNVNALVSIVSRGRRTVRLSTARRIAATYDELWNTPPPTTTETDRIRVTRVLAHARTRRWPPPLAWDDERIDNPRHQPAGLTAAA